MAATALAFYDDDDCFCSDKPCEASAVGLAETAPAAERPMLRAGDVPVGRTAGRWQQSMGFSLDLDCNVNNITQYAHLFDLPVHRPISKNVCNNMTLQKGRDDISYSLKPGKFTYTQLLYVFSVLRVAGSCRLTVYSLVYSIRYYVPIPMKLASVDTHT